MWLLTSVILISLLQNNDAITIDDAIAGATSDVGAMDFIQDDETVLVELDMKYTKEDWEIIQQSKDEQLEKRKKRKAIRFESRRWTNKIVPYYLSNVFTSRDLSQIRAAIADWERYTCLDFRPYRNGDSNYILLQNGGGCSSYVGMQGGSQSVSLAPGCRIKSIIIHELGHAIGFQHEQTRPDRDSYVSVYYQNIIRGTEYNFQKYTTATVNNYQVPYDYSSVMHYGGTAFSSNGQYTIVTKDSSKQRVIGNAAGHSFRDIKMANLMYRCSASCPAKSCPGEGFVGKDCQCWCPGNPVQICQGGGVVTTSKPPVTSQPATTASPGPDCYDNNVHCASWASKGECNRNPAYMLSYCKKSCKVCGGGGGGGGGKPCTDNNSYCNYWASVGYCNNSMYREYMKTSCRKSCRHCSSGSSTGNCHDYNSQCRQWARTGECRRNPAYMTVYCAKSCATC